MPRHIFDRLQIVAEARRILDERGLAALTIRSLASALGTGPASIYGHLGDRRELLQAVADDAAKELPIPDPSLSPHDRLVGSMLALYDYFEVHPWLVELIAAGDVTSDNASLLAEIQLAALEEMGFRSAESTRAYRSLNALLIGSLMSKHPYAHGASDHDSVNDNSSKRSSREAFAWGVDRLIQP
jgi:AcrR family transcriptional regulator